MFGERGDAEERTSLRRKVGVFEARRMSRRCRLITCGTVGGESAPASYLLETNVMQKFPKLSGQEESFPLHR